MNVSPLTTPFPRGPAAPAKSEGEGVSKPSKSEDVKAEAGSPPPMQPDKPMDGDFAALLAASRPQTGDDKPPAKGQGTFGKQAGAEALSTMVRDVNALIAQFQKDDGTPDPAEMITAFVAILQGFDAATEGNAAARLVASLGQLDAAALARLDNAAQDPASLFATLAGLAALPVTESGGLLVAVQKTAPMLWSSAEGASPAGAMPHQDRTEQTPLPIPRSAQLPALDAGLDSPQPPAAGPADLRPDVRGLVTAAITATTAAAGTEADAMPLPVTTLDARPLTPGVTDTMRAPDAGLPPASGFARNLVQQIRTAQFSDGQTRISLAPRGLGEIEIDMRPDEAGKLRIILRAENPAVLQALRGDRDGLLLTLSSSGADVRDADLSFEDFSHRHRREAEQGEAPSQRAPETGRLIEDDLVLPVPRHRPVGSLDMLT